MGPSHAWGAFCSPPHVSTGISVASVAVQRSASLLYWSNPGRGHRSVFLMFAYLT